MDKAEKEQMKKLGRAGEALAAGHRDLARQIGDGLLVALAGGCRLAPNPGGGAATFWEVRTPHLYRVRLEGVPLRWRCSCPQGASYGPVTGDFFGHPGRVCKHVAAVAICLKAAQLPGRPANVLALVERVCLAGAGGLGEAVRDLPLGGGARLARVDSGAPGLRLRLGRVESRDLVWGVAEDGGLVWVMDPEAGERYREWVTRVEEEVIQK